MSTEDLLAGSSSNTVGLLHPGMMGAAVAAEIRRKGYSVLWCSDGRSVNSRRRAEEAGLRAITDLGDLLEQCGVVLSICPPAAAEGLAGQVAERGYRGVYADANAVAPDTMRRVAGLVSGAGAIPVDATIIGPPPGHGPITRLYLAGPRQPVCAVARLVAGTRVEPVWLGEELGKASALKMAFASYQKASRTLAALAHALSDQHGVTDALLAEAKRLSTDILANREYLPSVAARAWRWAPEMREVARTLDAAGLPTDLADATAAVLARWASEDPLAGSSIVDEWDGTELSVASVLERLHAKSARQ